MSSLDEARQTQLDNIQEKTGKSLDELTAIARKSGLTKHGEIRDYLKSERSLGHGDANALAHAIMQSDGQRPIHEALMKHITRFGEFEVVPKKGYVSLRRAKQFAMIG